MARRQREYNGNIFIDDGNGQLYNADLKKYLIYRPYPMLVDKVNASDKVEPDNKQEYTSEQLKDKFGTDDTELINAGKEKEDQVAKVEEKETNWQDWSNELFDRDKTPSEIAKDWNKITGQIADEVDYENEDLPDIADKYLMKNGITEENGYDTDYILRLRDGIIESMHVSEYSVDEVKDLGITDEDLEAAEEYSKTVDRQPWKNDSSDSRPNETKLYDLIDDGIVYREDVNNMALKYASVDDIKDAMRVLDYDMDKYTDIDSIYNDPDLDDEDYNIIGNEVLHGMSDDDIGDMMRSNGIESEEEEFYTTWDYDYVSEKPDEEEEYKAVKNELETDKYYKKSVQDYKKGLIDEEGLRESLLELSEGYINNNDKFIDRYINELTNKENSYEEVESKYVPDADGFTTEYTLYKKPDGGYVTVFGDKDLYRPEDEDFDMEFDTIEEAKEFFDTYQGFDDSMYTIEVDNDEEVINYEVKGIDDARIAKEDNSKIGKVRILDADGNEIIEDQDKIELSKNNSTETSEDLKTYANRLITEVGSMDKENLLAILKRIDKNYPSFANKDLSNLRGIVYSYLKNILK